MLSTHSPLVISDCKNVLAYLIGDEELIQLPSLYGQDANTVLLEIMDTDIRNAEINESLSMALDAIHDSNLSQAKEIIQQLEEELPSVFFVIWNYQNKTFTSQKGVKRCAK
ncbi:hypothetical protein MMF16_00025740 [Enterobacter hormaechei]